MGLPVVPVFARGTRDARESLEIRDVSGLCEALRFRSMVAKSRARVRNRIGESVPSATLRSWKLPSRRRVAKATKFKGTLAADFSAHSLYLAPQQVPRAPYSFRAVQV
jgi:hypothetical protein